MVFINWDIWLADVIFSDAPNESKERPVLVVGRQEVLVLTFKMTGTERISDYKIVNWNESGLDKQTFIVCDRTLLMTENMFIRKLGTLHPDDINAFRKHLALLKEKESSNS